MIAGFGSIGRRHFRNLLALGEQDIRFFRTRKSTLPEDELAGYMVENSLEEALHHKPEAVIVSNPTGAHLDVAIPAVQAGCHLLLEKPISHNLDRLPELEQAMRSSGSRLLVGYQFRFHPVLQQVKRLLDEGAIGRPLSARAHWGEYLPDWHPWEDYRNSYSARGELGGGVVLTLSHPLDYLHWFFGEVDNLWAYVDQVSDLELHVDDFAEIAMRFHNGVSASLQVNYFQRPPVHRLEVAGTLGTLTWDNSEGTACLYRVSSGRWENILPPPGFERNDLFISEMRHFIEVAAGSSEPCCTLEDGKTALELALAAMQSARQRRCIQL